MYNNVIMIVKHVKLKNNYHYSRLIAHHILNKEVGNMFKHFAYIN